MSELSPQPDKQTEIEQLTQLVKKSLARGESHADVAQQLVDFGWERLAADKFVNAIGEDLIAARHSAVMELESQAEEEYEYENASEGDGGGGAFGWAVWIGAILLFNFLSYLFGWSFWVY